MTSKKLPPLTSEFQWFMAICNWEFDHIEGATGDIDTALWQAIAAHFMGLDR